MVGRHKLRFAKLAPRAGEADVAKAAREAQIGKREGKGVHDQGSLSGKEWEQLGMEMQRGTTEVIGVMPQGESLTTGHSVNVTQIQVQDKLRIFGGGTTTVFKGANVWNPLGGTVHPQKSFFRIIWIHY